MADSTKLIAISSVEVPPIVKVTQLPVAYRLTPPGGSQAYQHGTIMNGYGRAAQASITIPYGISIDLTVDMTVHAISYERFDEWHTWAQQNYSSYDWHYLNEHYDASAQAGGWFCGFFGGASASGDYNHYKNSADSFQSSATQQSDGIVKSIYNLDDDVLRVSGKADWHDAVDDNRRLLLSLDVQQMDADDMRHTIELMEESIRTMQRFGTQIRLACEGFIELLDQVPPDAATD